MKQKLAGFLANILAVLRPLFGRRKQFLIVSSDDTGSCGDQAMIEGIRSVVSERYGYDIALMHPAAISKHVELLGPVTQFTKPETNENVNRLTKYWRRGAFHMLLPNQFGFIGADVLDGGYNEHQALQVLAIFDVLMTSGAKGRIFGSSISEARTPRVMNKLNSLSNLELHIRDPLSQRRFEADFGRKPMLVADVAFNLKPAITSPTGQAAEAWVEAQKGDGQFVLGVNINGHTLGHVAGDGRQVYADLLSDWLAADPKRSILMLPHDVRPWPTGDVEVAEDCCNALTATFPDRVEMLRPPLNAWELKHLAGMVDLVLTGRMHLAIAALGMGTPPLCVAYMNKFEGLFQLFDIDGLVVEPALVSECDEMLAKMAEVVGGLEELEGKIKFKLPEIMDLSAKNFETLAN